MKSSVDQPAVQQCLRGLCCFTIMVIPSWHENSVGTVAGEAGLRGCLGALSLLYPANDTCHFCSQSTGQKWSHGQSSYKGSWEIGRYTQICGEHHIRSSYSGSWGINTDMW